MTKINFIIIYFFHLLNKKNLFALNLPFKIRLCDIFYKATPDEDLNYLNLFSIKIFKAWK